VRGGEEFYFTGTGSNEDVKFVQNVAHGVPTMDLYMSTEQLRFDKWRTEDRRLRDTLPESTTQLWCAQKLNDRRATSHCQNTIIVLQARLFKSRHKRISVDIPSKTYVINIGWSTMAEEGGHFAAPVASTVVASLVNLSDLDLSVGDDESDDHIFASGHPNRDIAHTNVPNNDSVASVMDVSSLLHNEQQLRIIRLQQNEAADQIDMYASSDNEYEPVSDSDLDDEHQQLASDEFELAVLRRRRRRSIMFALDNVRLAELNMMPFDGPRVESDDDDTDLDLDDSGAAAALSQPRRRSRRLMRNAPVLITPVQSEDEQFEIPATAKRTQPPEVLRLPWEETTNLSLQWQRKMLEQLFDIKRRDHWLIDLAGVKPCMKRLLSSCSCPHGLRTVGTCSHRVAFLELLALWAGDKQFRMHHLQARRAAALQTNIESWRTDYADIMEFAGASPPPPMHLRGEPSHVEDGNEDDNMDYYEDELVVQNRGSVTSTQSPDHSLRTSELPTSPDTQTSLSSNHSPSDYTSSAHGANQTSLSSNHSASDYTVSGPDSTESESSTGSTGTTACD
jgi:hypothetical protein